MSAICCACSRFVERVLSCPWAVSAGLIAVSAASLGLAYTAQYGFGLQPCILCLYQRVPYAVVIGLGLIGLALARKAPRLVGVISALAALAFLVGGGLGAFQVGVEEHWWRGFAGCSTDPDLYSGTVEEIMKKMAEQPTVSCDQVQFRLFGVSMAGWNAVYSAGLATGAAVAAWLLLKGRAPAP